jgi:FMN phosphatase YigB (HAD superfamily)
MSENDIRFLSYEEALKIVAAIQEEEDIENANNRILTVYNYDDREVCWFDYDEVMSALKEEGKSTGKEEVQKYILHRIPDWAVDI